MAVYTIKQANTIKGKPVKTQSTVVREKALITNAYADEINENYEASGKYAVLDEELTKEYEAQGKTKAKDSK